MTRQSRIAALHAAARDRILVLDGAWGVMIQRQDLSEADFRGDRFADHTGQMKGNNDILCLTRPDVIADLHDQYFAAGADISETNNWPAPPPTAGRRRSRTSRASPPARSAR
jgi:5-methyltetrahydrofolate--homocysteine methyltransferase